MAGIPYVFVILVTKTELETEKHFLSMKPLEWTDTDGTAPVDEASDRILTIPNLISLIRLLLAPVFMVLLMQGNDLAAAILFAVAAATDFVDGQIARRTNSVSKVGQLLDPAVDRIIMICAVVGLLLVGRLPVWIVLLVLARDIILLVGQVYLLQSRKVRVPVIYAGKIATTLLFVGLAGLLLNAPLIPGLGLVDFSWLPGFNSDPASWGIWFVYAGLVMGIYTTVHYIVVGVSKWIKAGSQ